MTEPKRWTEAGGAATQTEQVLVRAGQDLRMSSQEKQAIWNRIVGTLPTTVEPMPADGHAPMPVTAEGVTSSLWLATGAKIGGVLLAVSGIVGGYFWLEKSAAPGIRQTTHVVAAPIAPPMVSAARETVPGPEPSSARIEAPSSTRSAVARPMAAHASQLREESIAVMAARQALRSNDASKALRLLEDAQQRFKKGALLEEREALMIDALARSGQSERAAARARTFLTHYPRSPHAADVQRFVTK